MSEIFKRKNLTLVERRAVITELLQGNKNGSLIHGDIKRVAEIFDRNTRTIARLWKSYKTQKDAGIIDPDIGMRRKGKCGRKGINIDDLRHALQMIPIKNHTTQRALATQLGIPLSTLHDNIEKLGFRSCTTYLKPLLTDECKLQRLRWATRWVMEGCGGSKSFHHFEDFVHLDEKWFFIRKGGKPPARKVVFLAAVARPRFDTTSNKNFDGKLGIFPFVERVAGMMEIKTVEVTREKYKKMLIDNVIPEIKKKWPAGGRGRTIFIQQDGGHPHNINDDQDVLTECTADGWDFRIINQSPNSPDVNTLDLGVFNSIRSLQDRIPRTVDQLINAVKEAFDRDPAATLEKVWTTLQVILQEIMLCKGDNTFKLPHLRATKEERATAYPREMPCSPKAWEIAQSVLGGV
ncbi:unnamed protein product [Choristocarpus tenellus]